MRYLDLKTTLGAGILTKVDRASMAVALEVRPVFLHRELLALARTHSGPPSCDRTEAKTLLRGRYGPGCPRAAIDRPKMGFAMPLGRWLAGLSAVRRAAADRPAAGVLDPAAVTRLALPTTAGVRPPPNCTQSRSSTTGWRGGLDEHYERQGGDMKVGFVGLGKLGMPVALALDNRGT